MPRQLTQEECIRLQLAAKGESRSHRHWPPDVVRAFAGAETAQTADASSRRAAPCRVARRIESIRWRLRASRPKGHAAGVAAPALTTYEGET